MPRIKKSTLARRRCLQKANEAKRKPEIEAASNVDMSGASAEFVRQAIAKNKVVIFSKSYCAYCTMAKEQFKKLNFPFVTIELENRDDCIQIQAVLGEMTGATTVPRVFVDGNFIGGGTDVKKLQETGELQKLLKI